MPRESKIHFAQPQPHGNPFESRCGTDGHLSTNTHRVTCRACWYRMLADVAPWAEQFLKELRKQGLDKQLLTGVISPPAYLQECLRSTDVLTVYDKLDAIRTPRASPKPMDSQEKGLGNGFARAFSQECRPEEAVRALLSIDAAYSRTIKPVMDHSGAPTDAIGIQPGQVAEDTGNAGQVSDEAFWGY